MRESCHFTILMSVRAKNAKRSLIVVGHGMVGHRLVAKLVELGVTREHTIDVFREEPRLAHDRVALSSLFDDVSPEDLSLVRPGFFDQPDVRAPPRDRVTAIDRAA